MLVFNFVEILLVVLGDVNRMMWQIKFTLDPEIHHECGAGIFLPGEFLVRPATPELIRQGVGIAVEAKMNGIMLGFYDGADFPNLRAVREGLVGAGLPVAPAS